MIRIERATIDDVPQITHVLRETWLATYSHFLSAETLQNIMTMWHNPQHLTREIQNPQLFVGVAKEADGNIVGVATAGTLDNDTMMLYRLYVLPAYQRQGVGDKLMQAARAAFPDVRSVRLEVEKQNQIGRSFYRKQGFREIGTSEVQVGNERIAVVEMEKVVV